MKNYIWRNDLPMPENATQPIQITEGKFSGIIFCFDIVSFGENEKIDEETGDVLLNCDYTFDIIDSAKFTMEELIINQELKETISSILNDILMKAVRALADELEHVENLTEEDIEEKIRE